MKRILVKKREDTVGNALEHIALGDAARWDIDGERHELVALTDVPFAFKVAVKNVKEGDVVVSYGEPIGVASANIAVGECVHVHNLQGQRATN